MVNQRSQTARILESIVELYINVKFKNTTPTQKDVKEICKKVYEKYIIVNVIFSI